MKPDTIVPGVANPQAWNRYSYALNNPTRYNDPSGNKPCWATSKYSCNLSGKDVKKLDTSSEESDRKFISDLLNSGKCDPNTSKLCVDPDYGLCVPKLGCTGYSGSDADEFKRNFKRNVRGLPGDPDALILGISGSGSAPGVYETAGAEDLLMINDSWDDWDYSTFNFSGHGSSVGFGGNAAVYTGFVYNLDKSEDYSGFTNSAGLTFSRGKLGLTIGYFWVGTNPFGKGTTKGVFVGYAPGVEASIWAANTYYEKIIPSP